MYLSSQYMKIKEIGTKTLCLVLQIKNLDTKIFIRNLNSMNSIIYSELLVNVLLAESSW